MSSSSGVLGQYPGDFGLQEKSGEKSEKAVERLMADGLEQTTPL